MKAQTLHRRRRRTHATKRVIQKDERKHSETVGSREAVPYHAVATQKLADKHVDLFQNDFRKTAWHLKRAAGPKTKAPLGFGYLCKHTVHSKRSYLMQSLQTGGTNGGAACMPGIDKYFCTVKQCVQVAAV